MVFLTLGEIDFQKECFSTAFEEIPISFANEVALNLSFSTSKSNHFYLEKCRKVGAFALEKCKFMLKTHYFHPFLTSITHSLQLNDSFR